MELSQENRYVVECFKKHFSVDRQERVVIYGIGQNTRAILEETDVSNVIGLMDASCEGKMVMGYPVMSVEEVRRKAGCVVIVARNSVVPIIFERIKILEEKYRLPIYNICGERIAEKRAVIFENDHPYWEKKSEDMFYAMQQSAVVSFDIFDTLIVRDVCFPTDIFELTEIRLKRIGICADDLANVRRGAESKATRKYPKLEEIYEIVMREMQWSIEEKNIALEIEMSLELMHCFPRKYMRTVFQRAIDMGKRVILVSDMYLPVKGLTKILDKCGIIGYERIYISCEESADKKSGEIYHKIKNDGYSNILHIGDDPISDGKAAEEQGIRTFTIWSPYELMVRSSMHRSLVDQDTIEKRNLVGRMKIRLFDDPFCLSADKGMVKIDDPYMVGYIFLAPLISMFLSFLKDVVLKQGFDKILFCARDGHVIWDLYEKIRNRSDEKLPQGLYFKTSRRAITVASIRDETDILRILQKPFNATMGELLSVRFGIVPDKTDPEAGLKAVSMQNAKEVERFILRYKEDILENASRERKGYRLYMDKECLKEGDKIALYDFCSAGTIQYHFEKIIEANVKGVYFASMNIPNQFYKDLNRMITFLGNIGYYDAPYHLAKHYVYMESVLTEEHGTLIKFDENGMPVYDDLENKRRNLDVIKKMQKGIIDHCEEIIDEIPFQDYERSKQFADEIFGMLFQPGRCVLTEELKNAVIAESEYDFLSAHPAWQEE